MTLHWMAAKIVLRPVGELRAHAGNARLHAPEQIEQIKASMLAFGFTNPPLVDEDGVLIAGHGRLEAAQALGIAKVAAPYHPHPMIVRLSDFKTKDYAHLIGGGAFDIEEESPMLGQRGATCYYGKCYREGFAPERLALQRMRETIGLTDVIVMVPFCRTPEEAERVLAVIKENGLERNKNGLDADMMCENPAKVFLAEEGIDTISLNLGSFVATLWRVAEVERRLDAAPNAATPKRSIS